MIIYYNIDATSAVACAWTYVTHPDYMVILGRMHATYLYLEVHMFTVSLSSFWVVGYMPMGAPCDCMVAIVGNSDTAQPFVVTSVLAL